MTAVTDLRFGSHSVTSDFSQPPSHESTHTQTHTLYNQVPCWFAVYDTEPPPQKKKKQSLVSTPSLRWQEGSVQLDGTFVFLSWGLWSFALHLPNQRLPCQPGEGGWVAPWFSTVTPACGDEGLRKPKSRRGMIHTCTGLCDSWDKVEILSPDQPPPAPQPTWLPALTSPEQALTPSSP